LATKEEEDSVELLETIFAAVEVLISEIDVFAVAASVINSVVDSVSSMISSALLTNLKESTYIYCK